LSPYWWKKVTRCSAISHYHSGWISTNKYSRIKYSNLCKKRL
jgi:hypothetical protein